VRRSIACALLAWRAGCGRGTMRGERMADLSDWLQEIGLEQYARVFAENDIDLEVLPELSDQDLKELGLSLGHRRRLLRALALRAGPAPEPPQAAAMPTPAERRQLSVLFCDLVGSTELAARLDPEDLREVMQAYQDCCAAVITGFEGHVAKVMGDGVLAYFGYPVAHEDDPERAVRAALQLVRAVEALRPIPEVALEARIGIATGLVVVGDLISVGATDRDTVVGETPNLAARLQTVAEPGEVVVAAGTRRLLGRLFELADLGERRLKGFARPVHAFRVVGESAAEGRFEARQATAMTPLVGREHELGLLLDRWQRARGGEGQAVLLTGEPGIGKSRIVRALRERLLAREPHTVLRYQCSPYYGNSALHPVSEQIERAAGIARDDPADARLDKLEALIVRAGLELAEATPLIAGLLSIPTGGRYPESELGPQRRKEKLLDCLIAHLVGLAGRRPVLVVYEDAHWIDPTTLELLTLTIARVPDLPVLVVVTARPEFVPPWDSPRHLTLLPLTRMGRQDGAALALRVTGGKALPSAVLAQIVAKTDGVPLFVEELTKTVLESGLLHDAGDRYELAGPLGEMAIPVTLHASLMARLDRLAPVKEIAQIGAVIGREFPYELLAAVTDFTDAQLAAALDQLCAAELIFQRGTPPEATYSFKHALIQDAAYQSLLRSRRQQLHARIATALEERFPEIARTEPELVAHHFTVAGDGARAVRYWHRAGLLATARSATTEAIAHLRAGLALLRSMPEATGLEADLQLALGGALAAARGHGVPETGEAFARAVELARASGRTEVLYPALDGQVTCHFSRAELGPALELAEAFLAAAREHAESAPAIVAHADIGIIHLSRGALDLAESHFERAIALFDPARHGHLRLTYSYDFRVIAEGYLAWTCHALGFPDQARRRSEGSIAIAREVAHPLSLGFALARASAVHQLRRDVAAVEASTEAMQALATEQGLGTYIAMAAFYRGWALVQRGGHDAGIALLEQALAAFRASRDEDFFPFTLAVVAEALAAAGAHDRARVLIGEGLERVARNEEGWFAAELLRLESGLLLAAGDGEVAHAEAGLRRAIAVARRQNARTWELRATRDLARLLGERGERRPAFDLLAPVLGGFDEGRELPDLVEAAQLLDALH